MAKVKKKQRQAKPPLVREDPEYLNVRELAQLFGISEVSILRHLPKMRTVRFGRRVLVRRQDAHDYAQSLIREPLGQRRSRSEVRAAAAP